MSTEFKDQVTIMFWNLKKNKDTLPLVAGALSIYNVDICVLAEFPEDLSPIVKIRSGYKIFRTFAKKSKVCYIYNHRITLNVIKETQRWSMLGVKTDRNNEFLLVGCHLIDPIFPSVMQRYEKAKNLSEEIRKYESDLSTNNTIVIGDLNMNPFDDGISGVLGLNAVMDLNIAKRTVRRYESEDYPYFYNPMWYFMGHPQHANGTIYYNKQDNPLYWHMFDQVLLRPALAVGFNHNNLAIITTIGSTSLLDSQGVIDNKYSDHLPICITLPLT